MSFPSGTYNHEFPIKEKQDKTNTVTTKVGTIPAKTNTFLK